MDNQHFDHLIRALQRPGSRRGTLTALLTGLGMALLPGADSEAGRGKGKHKRRKRRHGKNAHARQARNARSERQREDQVEDRNRITICHNPGTPDEQTLVIARLDLNAHMRHGDALGPCPPCVPDCAGKVCGADDGCGAPCQTGSCPEHQTCGGGGSAGVCGCTPTNCAAQGKTCGTIDDECGGLLNCGSCASPQTCGGGGEPNVCGCTPNCAGKLCDAPDGCNGTCPCPGSEICTHTGALTCCCPPGISGICLANAQGQVCCCPPGGNCRISPMGNICCCTNPAQVCADVDNSGSCRLPEA